LVVAFILLRQDRFDLMYWNQDVNRIGINVGQLNSLIGESLHTAVIGSVLMAIYAEEKAPWWARMSVPCVPPSAEPAASEQSLPVQRKKRRTGALKVRMSEASV
jgi:hypothetical protein